MVTQQKKRKSSEATRTNSAVRRKHAAVRASPTEATTQSTQFAGHTTAQALDCVGTQGAVAAVRGGPPGGLFFESAGVRAWYSGSARLPKVSPGVLDLTMNVTPSTFPDAPLPLVAPPDSGAARDDTTTPLTSPPPMMVRCTADVYTEVELLEMDNNMNFMIPTSEYAEKLKAQAITAMTAAWEEPKPCCICELSFPCCEIEVKSVTDEFIELMRRCLIVHPNVEIPSFIVKQYDVSDVDTRLRALLLYRAAIFKNGDMITMNICSSCKKHIETKTHVTPPSCAIANGNYSGYLPAEYKSMTRTDEQAVGLVLPCVSLSVVSGGSCKTIKSHHYVVQNTEGAIVEMLPRDLTSRVRVTMVGSMTPAQVAACKKKYELNLPLCRRFLCFLKLNNRVYKPRSESVSEPPTPSSHISRTCVIVDRTASSDLAPDNDEVITNVRDESTYSSFGSAVQEGEDQTIEDTWIGASSFLLQQQHQNWADILVRKSNVYEPMSKWAICVKMFPTLFPGGCGGPGEPRLKQMSVRKWILRCLQVHGHRFEMHHAFMLLAFDYLASQNARHTLYVKMNVKRQALKAAEIPRTTVREAIKYFNHLAVCRTRGVKPRPPSLDVQRVIDVRKGLHVPESAFYGSNTGRMRARHDLFGLLKRFGPLQIFFTVSPDSAGTYSISIKSGRVTKEVIDEANVALLPKRAERKALAAMHPVECARYFLKVMKTIIDVLLGWDQKTHAPKRGGGIFGVVRAFGAATETQLAGDLHAHIAVWLHGFPTTSDQYEDAMNNNSGFLDRVVLLADSVLSTKPPCIVNETGCPCCSTENSLQPIVPGVDAFRRPVAGASPPATSRCTSCDRHFHDKDIIDLSIQAIANKHHIQVDSCTTDFEKCRPPQIAGAGNLDTSLLVRDVQVHYWNHCKSCFKATVRTPKASVCRFLKPEEVHLGATTVEGGKKLRLHRAIGCEYVNAYNPVVMSSLKCNHDAQFVVSSGAKHTAAYVVKYCFKNQNPVENYSALSLAAFAKATNKTSVLPPETSDVERGYRILGSMLYTVTNGQEIAATMAALYILNESPFWFSHEFVHVNLKNLLQKQMDSVEVTVSQGASEAGQIASVMTDNVLERYWKRDYTLENTSFMDICEQYVYSGKKKTPSSNSLSTFQSVSFSKMPYRKIVVLCGEEIPDITSHLEETRVNYYYSAVLTLFKPHRQSRLLVEDQSPLMSYRAFLQSSDVIHVRLLQQFEAQWRDYYRAQQNDDREEESPEELLLRTRAPPTASSYSSYAEQHRPEEDDEIMSEPIPDDLLDGAAIAAPATSTTKLVNDAATTTNAVANLATAMSSACKQYGSTSHIVLPLDFTFDSYLSRIVKPCDENVRCGTQEFLEAFPRTATRLERLQECFEPVPYSKPPSETRWTPATLPLFPTIATVSEAFKLNFWQHVMFEVAARNLLYAYSKDIDCAADESLLSRPAAYDIKPQLIAYLGGQAGTGKSTVVDALLAFAREWGRDGSVETLAFTGAAAINIHGKTMHSARNLKLNGAEPNAAPSQEMKTKFRRVVLVVIDEISITDQALLGGTDSVSRVMSMTPGKFMGGKHVMLIGDFLQLPPVGGHPCFQAPSCLAHRLRHAGYALYSAINTVVFLTTNMRALADPVYAEILDNLRWGRLSDDQLDLFNTRVQPSIQCEPPITASHDAFYRPVVVATNKLRCAINNRMIFQVAESRNLVVYECLASSSSRSKTIVDNLANATDDFTNRVPMKLLFYIGMPVMATRKHPQLLQADIIANGVIGTIVGTHPPPQELKTTRYSVNGVIIHRLVQHPELLLIKLFGCRTTLVTGLEEGVIGLPLLHARLQLTKILNLAQASVTVDQFAVVPAFSCTTEKLQGQTCSDGIVVTPLKRRNGVPKQTMYVALSRAVSLSGLTLTEKLTREYIDNFKPNEATMNEIKRLIQLVVLPPYASIADQSEFSQWKAKQHA